MFITNVCQCLLRNKYAGPVNERVSYLCMCAYICSCVFVMCMCSMIFYDWQQQIYLDLYWFICVFMCLYSLLLCVWCVYELRVPNQRACGSSAMSTKKTPLECWSISQCAYMRCWRECKLVVQNQNACGASAPSEKTHLWMFGACNYLPCSVELYGLLFDYWQLEC